jgi:hypothetical protein
MDDTANIGSPEELWRDAIDAYTRRLFTLASREANYTGLAVDDADHSITVYGVGAPSTELQDVMELAPGDVQVRWTSVAHTGTEMREAGARVRAAVPEVMTCWMRVDPLVLDFQVDRDRVDEANLERVTRAIQEAAGVPVSVVRGGVVPL